LIVGLVSNFIQTAPVNERILPERSGPPQAWVPFGRLGRGGTDSTPCPAGHLFAKSVDCRSGRAVDWEQLDAQGRVYAGAQIEPASYTIYGRDVLAVADTPVVAVIDGLPDQPPGKMPSNIAIKEADGNSIVLDLGSGR
jgi:hypothetical protein